MPATNGSRMSASSHNSPPTTTKVTSQKVSCRSKLIGPSITAGGTGQGPVSAAFMWRTHSAT